MIYPPCSWGAEFNAMGFSKPRGCPAVAPVEVVASLVHLASPIRQLLCDHNTGSGKRLSVKGAQASMPMLARCWMQCSGYLQAKGMPRCCASRRLWHGCCTQPRPFDSCCVTTMLDIVYPFQDQATILGAMLGQCWAAWGPCSGHVGAMCDHVTHVGLKLVHVRLLGPCQGHVGLLGLCWLYVGSWYVPVGHTFMSCAI